MSIPTLVLPPPSAVILPSLTAPALKLPTIPESTEAPVQASKAPENRAVIDDPRVDDTPHPDAYGAQPFTWSGQERVPPHSYEAEQALLGAILINNLAFGRVVEFLKPEHFAHPSHARIFEVLGMLIDKGQVANGTTVHRVLNGHADLKAVGGAAYIARLASSATTVHNAADYGRIVHELALKRELIGICADAQAAAFDTHPDNTAKLIAETIDAHMMALMNSASDEAPRLIGDYAATAVEQMEEAYRRGGKVSGLRTGYDALDDLMAGLQPGNLIILAARPSMGKSDLATNIADNVAADAEEGGEVLFESLEMGGVLLAHRLIAKRTGISALDQIKGNLDQNDFHRIMEAANGMKSLAITIDQLSSATLPRIRAQARRMKRRGKLKLIIVDYLQRMDWPQGARDENSALTILTKGLKSLAVECGVPLILLCQLNRESDKRDNRRPVITDLRGSGAIEQDADVIMFIYREEYYLSRAEPANPETEEHDTWEADMRQARGKMEVIIAKQRMGPLGTAVLWYEPAESRIRNYNERPRADVGLQQQIAFGPD